MPSVACEPALPGAAVKVFLYPADEEREARELNEALLTLSCVTVSTFSNQTGQAPAGF